MKNIIDKMYKLARGRSMDVEFEEPSPPYVYSNTEIAERESIIGAKFPDAFRDYMLTHGTQKIVYDKTYCLVSTNEYFELLQYDNFNHQAFFAGRHNDYLSDCEQYQFAYDAAQYFPFSKLKQTGASSTGVFHLFISLNAENHGTIWTAHDLYNNDIKAVYPVADSFGEFLHSLDSHRALEGKAQQHNRTLLYQWISEVESATEISTYSNTEAFTQALLEQPTAITINAARRLEFLHFQNSAAFKSKAEFTERCAAFLKHQSGFLHYASIDQISSLGVHEFPRLGTQANDFYRCSLNSTLVNGTACEETFVFYRCPQTQELSFVAVTDTHYSPVKISGLGTFEFDGTHWSLSRRKTPKWSPMRCSISIIDGEDLFSEANIHFIKTQFANAELKEIIEQQVFEQYTQSDYPEYLQADDDTDNALPKVTQQDQIWALLSNELRFYFDLSKHSVSIHSDYAGDDEHGIEITV